MEKQKTHISHHRSNITNQVCQADQKTRLIRTIIYYFVPCWSQISNLFVMSLAAPARNPVYKGDQNLEDQIMQLELCCV